MKKLLASIIVILLSISSALAFSFELSRDGHTRVVIAIAKGAPSTATYAANELAKYLEKLTGAKFRVTDKNVSSSRPKIIVGTSYKAEKPEEICVRYKDSNTIEITGEGQRGPIYAAYAFLEYLGCGFWSPNNETVPDKSKGIIKLTRALKIIEAPAFEYRQPLSNGTYSREWRTKVGINGDMWMLWREGLPIHGGAYQMQMGQWAFGIPRCDSLEDAASKGLDIEWLAWRKDTQSRTTAELCLTNTKLLDRIAQKVKAHHKKHPGTTYYNLSFGDDDKICQCPRCAKLMKEQGSASALVVSAANYVGKAIAQECPNARMMILAYWISRPPPRTLKLEPNVHVSIAHLRNFMQPVSKNTRYWKDMNTWYKLSRGNLFTWDYSCNFRSMLTPTPTIDAMGPTYRDYKKLGLRGIFSQNTVTPIADFDDLRSWIFAKLSWNPDQDEWALIDKWCDGACGEGSPYMKEWLRFSKNCVTSKGKGFGPYLPDMRPFFTPSEVLKGYDLFQKAIEATKDDPRTNRQVRKQYISIVTMLLTRYNFDMKTAADEAGVQIPSRPALIKIMEDAIKEFKCRPSWHNYAEGMTLEKFMAKIRNGEVLGTR